MFPLFPKTVAPAATSAGGRLPQSAISAVVAVPASRCFKPVPAALPSSGFKRSSHRAAQARYQAQCRRAMAF